MSDAEVTLTLSGPDAHRMVGYLAWKNEWELMNQLVGAMKEAGYEEPDWLELHAAAVRA